MNRKHTEQPTPKVRLAVKKETLKDLTPNKSIRGGGFIMRDTVIIPRR